MQGGAGALIPTDSVHYVMPASALGLSASSPDAWGLGVRECPNGHAAFPTDGHLANDTDRLASARARRAAAVRAVKSARMAVVGQFRSGLRKAD